MSNPETLRAALLLLLAVLSAGCGDDGADVVAPGDRGPHTWAEDFPSVATRRGGGAFVAYQRWTGAGDAVVVGILGDRSVEPVRVHRSETQVLGTAMAVDDDDILHVIWSERDDQGWSLRESLVSAPGPRELDEPGAATTLVSGPGLHALHPVLASDDDGRLLLVWQELQGPAMRIRARLHTDGAWRPPVTVSEGERSHWAPAATAVPGGGFAVVWDAAVDGDYDVLLARLTADAGGGLRVGSRHRVTDTPRFEGHASVTAHGDRLYVAYDVGPENWGREGSVNKLEVALHNSRHIEVAVVQGDRRGMPEADLMAGMSPSLQSNVDQPRIAADAAGNVVLFFRGMPLRDEFHDPSDPGFQERAAAQAGGKGWRLSTWYTFMSRLDAEGWSLFGRHRQVIEDSIGRLDAPISLGPLRGGGVAFATVGDGRKETDRVELDFGPDTDPHEVVAQAVVWWKPVTDNPTLVSSGRLAKGRPTAAPAVRDWRPLAVPREQGPAPGPIRRRLADGTEVQVALGDLHRHTDISRCSMNWDGSLTDAFRYAFDVAPLQYLAVTDHFEHMTAYDWWRTRAYVDAYNAEGRMVNLRAYERADGRTGHRNVIAGDQDAPLVAYHSHYEPARDAVSADSPAELADILGDQDVVTIPHTPAGMMAGSSVVFDWDGFEPRIDRLVEVFQSYRGNSEAADAPRGIPGLPPAFFAQPNLDRGLHFGFIASSDHQSSDGAFAGAWTASLTRADVFTALDGRLTFGSTVPLALWTEWDGVPMGVSAPAGVSAPGTAADFVVELDAHGHRVERIDLVVDGEVQQARTLNGAGPYREVFEVTVPTEGSRYVYARIVLAGEELAWSSPVRIGDGGPDGLSGAEAAHRHGPVRRTAAPDGG